jgi:hypothetical protein
MLRGLFLSLFFVRSLQLEDASSGTCKVAPLVKLACRCAIRLGAMTAYYPSPELFRNSIWLSR